MPKKKILFVITQGQWGGAQRYVFDLAVNLAKNFDITVAVGEPDGPKDLQQKLGKGNIPVIQLNHLIRSISPWHDVLAIFELAKLYKKCGANLVHLNSSKASIVGSFAKLIHPVLLIYTVHGWVFDEPMSNIKRWLYIQLEKIGAKFKDKIIVLSKKELETAKNILKIQEQKLAAISHGIAPIEKKYTKEEARKILQEKINRAIPDSAIWFGTVANFYKTKGIDILLDAITIQKNNIKDAHFILIGDGPEKDNLLKTIEKNNSKDNVHIAGWTDDAASLMVAFDYFLLPSRKEGYPYTILEATIQKIPIIATTVGGIPEIIEDKKTGILVEKENTRTLSEAIIFALNNPEKMKELAENNFSKQKKDGLEIMIQKTISLYSSLMN